MKPFLNYVMQSRTRAIAMALLFSLLPYFSWLGSAVASFVVLRKGPREGFLVFVWTLLPPIALAFSTSNPYLFLAITAFCHGLLFLCVFVLRYTGAWIHVTNLASFFCIAAIALRCSLVRDEAAYWQQLLSRVRDEMLSSLPAHISPDTLNTMLDTLAHSFLGYIAIAILCSTLLTLWVARLWQSMLYNPGGLKPELLHIRLNTTSIILLLTAATLVFTTQNLGAQILPVALLPAILSGLSLLHSFVRSRPQIGFMLIIFYIAMALFAPYVVGVLTLFALADSYFKFFPQEPQHILR